MADEYFTRSIPGEPTATRHLLPDALGSTVALTNDTGIIQTEYTYEPFGRTTVTGEASIGDGVRHDVLNNLSFVHSALNSS